jgi:DNA-binding NtrC family response regulator
MWHPQRVLVVDDDTVVGKSFNRVLSEQGYLVREALSGSEALEALDHQDYDLVFTDLRMPGMNGLDIASRLKKSHPEMPVVIITGHGTEASEQKARDLGVAGFLHKPLSPEMIVQNAERALQEKSETLEAIRLSALALMPAAAQTTSVVAVPAAEPAVVKTANVAKNVALFFAAPFIGLAYILAFPFVGFWAIGKSTYEALARRR